MLVIFIPLYPLGPSQWRIKRGAERAEARGPATFRALTNLHLFESFFLTKIFFNFKERSSLAETTIVFNILVLRGWGFGGKCDMLLVNSILIFISKNLLKVRTAGVIS